MDMTEKNWTEMSPFALPEKASTKVERECCDACREAREIKCVCACGGRNHGSALKKNVKRLDEFDENDDEPEDTARYIS
jgi:hypothetical protein